MKWAFGSLLLLASMATAQILTSTLEDETFRAIRILDLEQAGSIVDAVKTNVPDESLRPYFVRLLVAIRKAENGGDGKQFGIMNAKARTYRQQAGWCAATAWRRYEEWSTGADMPKQYLVYLAARYAPVKDATNDPQGLNVNFFTNLKFWMEKP